MHQIHPLATEWGEITQKFKINLQGNFARIPSVTKKRLNLKNPFFCTKHV